MLTKDLYWLAGLMEGEGYFGMRRGGRDFAVQLSMTDRDVVQRACDVAGFGKIKERKLPSGKTAYTLSFLEQDKAAQLLRDLLPLMGERRAARITYCLAEKALVPRPKREWTHCKNGHPLSGDNLKIITEGKYKKRRCIECGKLRQRKHRASREQKHCPDCRCHEL